MNHLAPAILALSLLACGGSAPPPDSPGGSGGAEPASASAGDEPAAPAGGGGGEEGGGAAGGGGEGENVFQLRDSSTAADARGEQPSKIKPTQTEAALRFFVVDKQDGPIKGIVISLTSPAGDKFYTEETDGKGYAEVLVPIGQTYELTYLSLGRRDVTAKVTVKDEPNQNIKLTLRYKRDDYMPSSVRRFVLKDVHFETGKATLTPGSFARLDQVVEFMTYKKSAKIEISGHTDNVGNARSNKKLSQRRANACRDYLVSKGIDPGRIKTVGYGAERPIASNDTEAGRLQNRRIEVLEL
ncbi:MAG TPA: OmpA family protein [Kofleriaceae bacterium]|nr:OmpA family protein [Kofleriaceae bacterium]